MRFFLNFIKRSVTLQEEVKLSFVKSVIAIHNHSSHLEREHELMAFEDTHARKLIHKLGEFISDVLKTSCQHIIFLRGLQRVHEHSHVRVQGVLVHVGNVGETEECEAEN